MYKKTSTSTLKASGVVFYKSYKEGILDEIRIAIGNWYKSGPDDSNPGFSARDKDGVNAVVNESELVFGYVYKNATNSDVRYSFQMRRSTLRFLETYVWEESSTPKTKKGPSQKPTQGKDTNSGYCEEFKQTSLTGSNAENAQPVKK